MNRFAILGDNCRLQGMTQSQAQTVIDRCTTKVEESDLFWEHFFYGTATEIVSIHGAFPQGYLEDVRHLFIDEMNSRPMVDLKEYIREQVRLLHKDGIPVVIPGCPLPKDSW